MKKETKVKNSRTIKDSSSKSKSKLPTASIQKSKSKLPSAFNKVNKWDCSVCTFKNNAGFKCSMSCQKYRNRKRATTQISSTNPDLVTAQRAKAISIPSPVSSSSKTDDVEIASDELIATLTFTFSKV